MGNQPLRCCFCSAYAAKMYSFLSHSLLQLRLWLANAKRSVICFGINLHSRGLNTFHRLDAVYILPLNNDALQAQSCKYAVPRTLKFPLHLGDYNFTKRSMSYPRNFTIKWWSAKGVDVFVPASLGVSNVFSPGDFSATKRWRGYATVENYFAI